MRLTRIVAASAVAATTLALVLLAPETSSAAWTRTSSFGAGVQAGAIAVDSPTNPVYVGGNAGKGIQAINGSSHKVIATYKSSHKNNEIRDLATDATNHYVVAADDHGAMIVNETTKAVKEVAWTYNADGIGVDPTTGLVFLDGDDENGNSYAAVINESTGAFIQTALPVTFGVGEVAVDTATHKVYMVGYNTGEISIINESGYGVGTISAANGECSSYYGGCGPSGIAVNSSTGMLYVSNQEGDDVRNFISVINTSTNAIVTELPVFTAASQDLDGPGYMAVNSANNTVYSVDYGPLLVIDGATNTVIKTVALGSHSYDTADAEVAVNSTTGVAYVASGQLSSKGTVYAAADVPLKLSAGTPKISGVATVNSVLSATTGTWTSGTTFAYQWKSNGVAVASGGTSSTYTVGLADAGKKLTVAVTGSQTGYATKTVTSKATKTVPTLPFTTETLPTISGNLTVGSTLAASASGWSPSATFTYAWYRSGKAIHGANQPTYALTASDRGKAISVRAYGHAVGYTVTSRTSSATAKIGYGTLTTAVPTITGTAAVGQKLTAVPGAWTTKTSFSFVWKVNGVAVKGATKSSFKVPTSAAGKTITVTVRGSKSGYTSSTVVSGGVSIPV